MRYEIDFVESALEQLRALPKDARRLIGAKLDRAQHDLSGDWPCLELVDKCRVIV